MTSRHSKSRLASRGFLFAAALTAQAAFGTTYTWDTTPNNGSLSAGTGSWNTSSANWTTDGGLTNIVYGNGFDDSVVFSASNHADIVTIGGAVNASSIVFNNNHFDLYSIDHTTINGGSIALTGTAPTITGSAEGRINSVLTGTEGLTKDGTGSVYINNANNTFTGGVTLSAGTLFAATVANEGVASSLGTSGPIIINGAGSTILSIGSGSTDRALNWTGSGTGFTLDARHFGLSFLNTAALTADSGKTLTLSGYGNGALAQAISGANNVVKVGTGTWTLSGANNYTGTTTISDGYLTFANTGALPATAVSITVTGSGSLVASGAYTTVMGWLGSDKINTASTGSIAIGANSSESIDFTGYDTLGLSAQTGGIYYSGTITAGTGGYRFGGANNTALMVSSVMTGAQSLNKYGESTLWLTATNNYTGLTTVSGGSLILGNASALGTTDAGTVVESGATLDLNGKSVGAESLTLNGGALVNYSDSAASFAGTVTINGSASTLSNVTLTGSVTLNSAVRLTGGTTLSGSVSGTGNITKLNVGDATISGVNSSTGSVTIQYGSLTFTNSSAAPDSVNSILINDKGVLVASGAYTAAGWLASGKIRGDSTGAISLAGNSSESLVFTGYNNLALGSVTNATYSGVITPGTDGYKFKPGNDTSLTVSGALTGANSVKISKGPENSGYSSAPGVLILTGNNSYTGETEINNTYVTLGHSNALGDAVGGTTLNGYGGVAMLDVNGYSTNESITLSRGQLVNGSTSAATISGTVTASGDSYISSTNGAGKLTFSGSVNLTDTVIGGVVEFTGPVTFSGSNGIFSSRNTNTVSISGATTLAGDTTLYVQNDALDGSDSALISGSIGGSGTLHIGSAGRSSEGYLILSGANTYTGGTMVGNTGKLVAGNVSALGTGTVTVNTTGTLDLAGYNVANAIALAGGTLRGAQNRTATITTASGNSIISSNVGGAVTIDSGASVKLSAGVTIAGGVTVNAGGVVNGTGNAGNLVVMSGGAIAPGNSPGILNASNVTWNGGGIYNWELNDTVYAPGTGQDQLIATGTINIQATGVEKFVIKVIGLDATNAAGLVQNWDPAVGYSWVIAHADAGIENFDTENFLLDLTGFTNATNGTGFTLELSQDQKDLILKYGVGGAIPEPSTYGLIGAGALAAVAFVRRRRKHAGLAKAA